VVAVEFDRGVVAALREVVGGMRNVEIVEADAMRLDWGGLLHDGPWILCANLPYNIATPLLLDVLSDAPRVVRAIVMVQREVGERLAASPGDRGYGAVSVRVAARARATIVRKVSATVFWPRPTVASVVVSIERLAQPPVDPDDERLWRVVDAGFAERRKTMRNALRRLGLDVTTAGDVLTANGLSTSVRAEELGLADFVAIAADLGHLEAVP
jgi:16S rRNA (adenine1518-N6/adenine1519-N6)-dimethyltransferase